MLQATETWTVKEGTLCPFAIRSKIHDCTINVQDESESTLQQIKAEFLAFLTSKNFHEYDGFLIKLTIDFAQFQNLTAYFKKLVFFINKPESLVDLENNDWRFSIENNSFFIIVLSRFYNESSTRWCPEDHYILLQPEHSFHNNIPRDRRKDVINSIRKIFNKKGIIYENIVKEAKEAQKYIFPLKLDGELINWWL